MNLMTNTKIYMIIALLVSVILLPACERSNTTAGEQAIATEELMSEAEKQIGMPNIVNFQERKLMKQIMELRDREDLITYAYIVNLDGDLIYLGQCVGFGLPYSVQFTSPTSVQPIRHRTPSGNSSISSYGQYVLEQPDPNGLYMPEGLSATWLMMLDEDTGEVRPVYVEPEIVVSPFRLH